MVVGTARKKGALIMYRFCISRKTKWITLHVCMCKYALHMSHRSLLYGFVFIHKKNDFRLWGIMKISKLENMILRSNN